MAVALQTPELSQLLDYSENFYAEPAPPTKAPLRRDCRGTTGSYQQRTDARGRTSTRWAWDRIPARDTGPKIHWFEPLPGFWLPRQWQYDPARWPDYTDPAYQRVLTDLPDPTELIRALTFGKLPPSAWGAWIGAWG